MFILACVKLNLMSLRDLWPEANKRRVCHSIASVLSGLIAPPDVVGFAAATFLIIFLYELCCFAALFIWRRFVHDANGGVYLRPPRT
jgi:Sec-independent protein secretion pathway component TatC